MFLNLHLPLGFSVYGDNKSTNAIGLLLKLIGIFIRHSEYCLASSRPLHVIVVINLQKFISSTEIPSTLHLGPSFLQFHLCVSKDEEKGLKWGVILKE